MTKTIDEQISEVRGLMDRISEKPWTPAVQIEFDSARKLLSDLRAERSAEKRS